LKDFVKLLLILFIAVLLIPVFVIFIPRPSQNQNTAPPAPTHSESGYSAPENIRILEAGSGKIVSAPMREYVIGAVMAEMPASFPDEAIKAQAVAIHTYAIREAVKAAAAHAEFDVSNDSDTYISYFNEAAARAFYTDGYETAYKKIAADVNAVFDYAIVYDGEPIAAVYFSCSGGRTDSAENVWGSDIPYLQSVDSSFDKQAPVYAAETTFTLREMAARLSSGCDITFSGDPADYFKDFTISPAGTVLTLRAGDKYITGQMFRKYLNLPSADFDVSYDAKAETFTVTTRGYGHDVGLSQYGAAALAQRGQSWRDILEHYYTGVEISPLEG
jgi:stage II sporulation protein D